MSREDLQALEILDKDTQFINGRYEVPMFWKDKAMSLPNNLVLAQKRFGVLERKLRANGEAHEGFKKVIDGYINAEPPMARCMTVEEARTTSERTCYLPMHLVTNPNKPGKIRVVNDAAAVFMGESLNSNLITGPDLLISCVFDRIPLRSVRT